MTKPDLVALAREAPAEELPALLGALEEARATAWARLHEEAARPREVVLLTTAEAALLARLPKRRIYSLARSASWAVRIGRRRLLVEKGLFLAAMFGERTNLHEGPRTSP